MRPLIVSSSDVLGGAARAAFRLHRGLRARGVESQMLVQKYLSITEGVIGPANYTESFAGNWNPRIQKALLRLRGGSNSLIFSPAELSLFPFKRKVRAVKPDLVNLHWLCDGMVRLESFSVFKVPVVWTLHDMWPFTGGCHYDDGCGRYMKGCGSCPQLNRSSSKDLSFRVLGRKRKVFRNLSLTIVTPSLWLAECARKSAAFNSHEIEVIPNGIDLQVFKPAPKAAMRELWNLPRDKKIVLFGAMSATSEPRKGFQFLSNSLQKLKSLLGSDLLLVIFGADELPSSPKFGCETRYAGSLWDEISLATLYSAADVMLVPSRQDNLPNTAVESIACGTPVVGFDVGGLRDIVEYQACGYLARPFDEDELAHGMHLLLSDPERLKAASIQARIVAERKFSALLAASRYEALFQNVIERHSGAAAALS